MVYTQIKPWRDPLMHLGGARPNHQSVVGREECDHQRPPRRRWSVIAPAVDRHQAVVIDGDVSGDNIPVDGSSIKDVEASGSYARKTEIANTITNTDNLPLRSILEKDKLTRYDFLVWERNLIIVKAPPAKASITVRNTYRKHFDYLLDVGYLMLATMSPDFRTRLINTNAYNMIRQLRDMFQTQACTKRYDASRALNACKMAKGTSVSDHENKRGSVAQFRCSYQRI
ncbi:hypothetical protein OSB04_028755 [Centaurea solstitialis]|uniref:Uncharacterized protein n=1 Tax=Centaurea solstitialis TaxID=347529 RepID=A0AA38SG91_9ASTR|nr:hypothetical protein OSB04_028755 [Centaurea solstitialis]